MRKNWKHIDYVSGIYTITCTVNNKIYVGLAVNMNGRCVTHYYNLINNKHYSTHIQNAWNKYGEDKFLFEELMQCDEEQLYSIENYWCNLLDTHNSKHGYNIANTGQSRKTRLTQESIEKRNKTRKDNAEKRGYWVHPDRIEKMKKEMKGKPIATTMVQRSVELSSKKTIQYDKYGNKIAEYKSQREASRKTGIGDKNINAVCIGKISTSGGYVWRSENDSFDKYIVLLEKPLPNNTRPILQYNKNGEFIKEHQSIRQAVKETGICGEVMRIQANGKMKTMQNVKYIWKWKDQH